MNYLKHRQKLVWDQGTITLIKTDYRIWLYYLPAYHSWYNYLVYCSVSSSIFSLTNKFNPKLLLLQCLRLHFKSQTKLYKLKNSSPSGICIIRRFWLSCLFAPKGTYCTFLHIYFPSVSGKFVQNVHIQKWILKNKIKITVKKKTKFWSNVECILQLVFH